MKITFNPPRPRWDDEGFALEAVHAFIKKYYPNYYQEDALTATQFDNGLYESLIEEFYLYNDPEALMQTLIKYHGWEFTREDWENIDCFYNVVDDLLKAREKRWAEENHIQPPFPIGSTVRLPAHYDEKFGVISKVYEYDVARYCILTESQVKFNQEREAQGKTEQKGGYIIKFEDVELAD